MSLIFHPASHDLIDRLRVHLPQSLLISGERGTGLTSTARYIADNQIIAVVEPVDAKGTIDHDRGTIKIEAIRQLYEQTRARHTSPQVVIIDSADRMSHGAQNAFLKLLEEPNEHIHFILTAHNPRALLPTIHSRVQEVTLLPITAEQTTVFLKEQGVTDAKKIAQLRFIADGLPAELRRLITDDSYFATRAGNMGDARTFIQGTSFERLEIAFKYSTQRDKALQLLDSSLTILRKSLSNNPEPRLVAQLERTLAAREAIDANHHARLQLTRIVV
jgi:DNA polymerase III delta prime subunit